MVSAFRDPVNLMITGNADLSVIESYEKEMEEAISNVSNLHLCSGVVSYQLNLLLYSVEG